LPFAWVHCRVRLAAFPEAGVTFSRILKAFSIFGVAAALIAAPACSSKNGGQGDSDQKGEGRGKGKGKRAGKGKGKGKGMKGKKGGGGKQAGPPAAAPPALAAKQPLALPDLPELGAQAKVDAPKPPTPESKCGDSAMGENVALDCPGGDEALPHPLVAVFPFATLHGDAGALPTVVDHRADGTEGAVRNQGKAPLSSAFALASAVDHAIGFWTGTPGKTSAMQVFARYHAGNASKAIKASADTGLAEEEAWPFAAGEAVSWFEACDKWAGAAKCGKAPDDAKLKAADAKPATTALETEDLGATLDVPLYRSKLAAGQDILAVLKLGPSFKPVGKEGAMYVPSYDGGGSKGVHTVLLAGYATFPHGTYFLVHNSAGEKWGDKGYAWIHEATLKANLAHAFVVDARPTDAAKIKRKVHKAAPEACKAGGFPDSVTGACEPLCPDHSPRFDNVCAKKDECPKGLVNVTGECVLAAPVARSDDKPKDARFICGPGGCFFRMPKGVGGCDKEWCPAACPAPTFRAMTGGHEPLTCWQ
jgi:Papain family cysteine protease